MKKAVRSRICKFSVLFIPLLIIVSIFQSFLFRPHDHNTQRLRDFYKLEEDSLDVVFLGASEIFSGYAPGYAYGKYGYTSYMYAIESNQGSLYKSQLKEILSRQSPQYIVIDVFGFLRAVDASLYEEARLRIYTESIPMSSNKVETIMQHPYENKISCFFPFLKYHGDLRLVKNKLSRAYNFLLGHDPSILKGMVTETTVCDMPEGDVGTSTDVPTISTMCRQYLEELLEYSKENKIQNLIFVNFPRYLADEENDPLLKRVAETKSIITQYNYPFIDLQEEKEAMELDFSRDFRNSHHLNVYGQFKVTDYFGKLFTEAYQLSPLPQSKDSISHWKDCALAANEYYAIADHAISEGKVFYLNDQSHEWISRNAQ